MLFEYPIHLPLSSKTKDVALAIEAKDFAKAMSLRDPEFSECLEGFETCALSPDKLLPEDEVNYLFCVVMLPTDYDDNSASALQ
jgi:hypothetical protein